MPHTCSRITGWVVDMGVSFSWNRPESEIIKDKVGKDRVQLFMVNEARKLMQPYVPEQNHILIKNVRTYVEGGQGIVHYLVPYARYQYHGKLMVSGKTGSSWSHGEAKVLTSRDLHY